MNRVGVSAFAAFFVLVLSGCTFKPDVLQAESVRADEIVLVTALLRSSDAQKIKSRELYFSLVIFDCAGATGGFPATPYIQGEPASTFEFLVAGEVVDVVGRIPAWVFLELKEPCVLLRGGGYFTGKLMSAPAPIIPVGASN